MKKKILFALITLLCTTVHLLGQNIEKQSHRRAYLKIADFKKKFPNKKIDFSKGKYQIYENDTLILIEDHNYLNRKSVPYQPKDSAFLELYKDVVYKKYSNKKSGTHQKEFMRLWDKPIKIYFASTLDSFYKNRVIEAATMLTEHIDSLHISFVDTAKEANYIIYQIKGKNSVKYTSKINNNKYINYYISWNRNKIYDTALEINLLNYSQFSKEVHANYILQNFYQTLGRFYKTNKLPCRSMFSVCNKNNKQLTKQDLEILTYHYSYGICKFTDLKTFEENHKRAQESLKKGHKVMFSHSY